MLSEQSTNDVVLLCELIVLDGAVAPGTDYCLFTACQLLKVYDDDDDGMKWLSLT